MESVILYLLVFFLSTFMLSKSKVGRGRKIDIYFLLAIIFPIIFASLRNNVGTDYNNYVIMYSNNASKTFFEWYKSSRSLEASRFLVWLIARISGFFNSQELFFAFFASFTVIPVAYRLKTDYDNSICALSYYIFLATLYCTGLNTCKQIAAIGIVFWGLKYLNERKFLQYAITVLLASLIHFTAIIAIILYFLYDSQKRFFSLKKTIYIVCGVLLVSVLPRVVQLLGGRFTTYFSYNKEVSNLSFYITLLWCLVFLLLFRHYIKLDVRNGTLTVMMCIGVLFSITGFYSPFVKRIALYFTFSQFILMGQLPNLFHKKKDKAITKFLIYCYTTILFIVESYVLGHGEIIPYHLIGGI